MIDFCSMGCYGFSLEVIVWGYVSYSFEQNPVLVYFAIKKLFFSCPGTEVFLSLSVCSLIFFFMSIFSLNYVLMSALIDGIFWFLLQVIFFADSRGRECVHDDCCFLLSQLDMISD